MGSTNVFCYKCRAPLTEEDFRQGAAFQVGSLTACENCVEALLAKLTPEQQRAVLKKYAQKEEPVEVDFVPAEDRPPAARLHFSPRPPHGTTAPSPGRPAAAKSPRPLLWIVAGGLAVLAILLAVVLTADRSPAPAPGRKETAAAGRERGAENGPARAEPARAEPASQEAKRPLRSEIDAALVDVEKEKKAAMDKQEFQKALDVLAAARKRYDDAAWAEALEAKGKEIREAAERYFGWVKAQALEAQKNGLASEVKRWRDEVAAWGMPTYVEELDKALAAAGEPLPLSDAERAALRSQLGRLSLFVLPNANSRGVALLKAGGARLEPLTWEEIVDAGAFTPQRCPIAIYAGGESYRPTVKSPRDVPAALIRYVQAGGTLAVFPSGPWPFYCDEQNVPIANDMAPLLPMGGLWDMPPPGTTLTFVVKDPRALPHVRSKFRFPTDGDRRWRFIQPSQARPGVRVTPLVELQDASGRSLGLAAAWMHTGQGRVLYTWFRLLDTPEGEALFHDLWQAIAAK